MSMNLIWNYSKLLTCCPFNTSCSEMKKATNLVILSLFNVLS